MATLVLFVLTCVALVLVILSFSIAGVLVVCLPLIFYVRTRVLECSNPPDLSIYRCI